MAPSEPTSSTSKKKGSPSTSKSTSSSASHAAQPPQQIDTKLFAGVKFVLNGSLRREAREHLRKMLIDNAATEITITSSSSTSAVAHEEDLKSITHYITDTLDFPQYSNLKPSIQQDATSSTNGKAKAVVATVAGGDKEVQIVTLPQTDEYSIAAAVSSLGGQPKRELTREVTHLLCLEPEGTKYEAWLKHGIDLGMIAVLPHWLEACFRLRLLLPTDIYSFPSPPYLEALAIHPEQTYSERLASIIKSTVPRPLIGSSATARLRSILEKGTDNENYQRSALVELDRSLLGGGASTIHRSEPPLRARIGAATTIPSAKNSTSSTMTTITTTTKTNPTWPPRTELRSSDDPDLFKGHGVYLASDLGLREGMEEAIKNRIVAAGGRCWSFGLDGGDLSGDHAMSGSTNSKRDRKDNWDLRRRAEKALEESSIVITRTREGWEWWKAFESNHPSKKMIGNLAWIYHVLAVGKLDPPTARLLHFPLPNLYGVEEFRGQLFTISNYGGPARDYVRAMIEALGGVFDGSMVKTTRYVVSSSASGNKVDHARKWEIPLVTHLWLEACLSKWSYINPALSTKYLVEGATPAMAFSSVLGEAKLNRNLIVEWAEREESRELREEALGGAESLLAKMEDGVIDPVDEEGDTEMKGVTKGKKSKVKVKPIKGKETAVDEDSEEDEEIASMKQARSRKSQKKLKAIQKRSSTELSSLSSDDDVPPAHSTMKPQSKPKTTSPVVKTNGSTNVTPASKGGRKSKIEPEESGSDSDSDASSATPEPSANAITKTFNLIDPANMITGGRRAAAGRAAERLAEQMPDANRFAKELKSSGKKKKVSLGAGAGAPRSSSRPPMKNESDEEEEEEITTKPLSKSKSKANGKRKAGDGERADNEDEDEKPIDAKTKKPKLAKGGRLATIQSAATASGQYSSFDNPPNGKQGKPTARRLMLMSTGLGLDAKSSEIKALKPLGITWTDNPSLVTHLVVRGMSRTEKFLCCLGVAPKIVTKEWIDASIKSGKLVDEAPYLLKDAVKEKEYKDTLVDILARAQARQLFEDYTIYITTSVAPDAKTMQRICQSGGGTVSISKLTPTIYNKIVENRERSLVISCPIDRQQWEPLTKKSIPIYSVEAVFVSVVHQTLVGFESSSNNRIDGQMDR